MTLHLFYLVPAVLFGAIAVGCYFFVTKYELTVVPTHESFHAKLRLSNFLGTTETEADLQLGDQATVVLSGGGRPGRRCTVCIIRQGVKIFDALSFRTRDENLVVKSYADPPQ